MKKTLRWLSLSLVFTAIAVHFNNCSSYEAAPSFLAQSSVSCTTDNCIVASVNNLSSRINFGGGTEFTVMPGDAEFNLGGDCNEGGFPFNTVRWELWQNNQKVRSSEMLNADSRCVNGRFMVYIWLGGGVGGDPINRIGLLTQNLTRLPYDLWVEIYGQQVDGGQLLPNSLRGRSRISLLAGQ